MKFLTNDSTDPHFNLAFDEYCLEHYPSDEDFFYLWRNRPAVIIGLNQNAYSEVNLGYLDSAGITLARRVTGGGAVYHDLQNLNYTIIGRSVSPEPVVDALRSLGLDAELTGRNDIFTDGRKISGYAKRVSNGREIVHGTLMYDVDIDTLTRVLDTPGSKMAAKGIASVKSRVANLKEYLPDFGSLDRVQAELASILAGQDKEMPVSGDMLSEVRRMAREKFATWDWIYGRSREVSVTCRRRFSCGTVEAGISLDRGIIQDIAFSGDFMFAEDPSELAGLLRGTPFRREAVQARLAGAESARWFPGTRTAQITELILDSIA